MKIELRQDTVEISGYVNAIERKSKPIMSRMGQFVERICKGAFSKAIARNDNIRLLLNHDWEQAIGNTKDGTLELTEDNIGLHARATITNPNVIQKARAGDLIGWSFGFRDRDIVNKRDENGYPLREVKDLDLEEVSILDRSRTPAYEGTLVSVRAEGQSLYYGACFSDGIEVRHDSEDPQSDEEEKKEEEKEEKKDEREKEKPKSIDYSEYDKMIRELKVDYGKYEDLIRELKYDNIKYGAKEDDDEIEKMIDEFWAEVEKDNEPEERYASKYYDPAKAHEYYEKHKQLKGKTSTKKLNDKGKEAAKYVKDKLKAEQNEKIEQHKQEMNAKIASLREQYKSLTKEQKKAMKTEIQKVITDLRNKHKKEKARIKAEYDAKYEEELNKMGEDVDMQKEQKTSGNSSTIQDLMKKAGII